MIFLPISLDPMGFGKEWIWGAMVILGLVIMAAGMILGEYKIKVSWWWIVWGLLVVWAVLGWNGLSAGAKMKSWMNPGGIGMWVISFGWMWLLLQSKDKRELEFLSVGGLLAGIASVVVFLMPESKLPLVWPKDRVIVAIGPEWSATGSLVGEAVLMAVLTYYWGKRLVRSLKEQKEGGENYVIEAAAAMFFGVIGVLAVYRIVKIGWMGLDLNNSWIIAVEAMKRKPFFGVGPGNFLEAYNLYRAAAINGSKFWAVAFNLSGLGILHWWTELGIGGLILAILMGLRWWGLRKKKGWVETGIVLAAMWLLPVNLTVAFVAVWVIARKMESGEVGLVLKAGEQGKNVMPVIAAGVILLGAGWGGYWWGRLAAGEYYYKQSVMAAGKNEAGKTYELQIKAIGMNPRLAEYRRTYSQTNLAIGLNMLKNKEVSKEDQEKAGILVQQAVREAKAAVGLEDKTSTYWANLASVYRQLIGMVEGVADWGLQSASQAAVLDPVNPLLKMEVGSIWYAGGKYEEADRVFEQVVMLKPDFANGWYNWAYTAKNLGKIGEAVTRLAQAVSLVAVDSGDYDRAIKELAVWRKELEELQKKQGEAAKPAPTPETLKVAEPIPTGKEQIKVPKDDIKPPEETVEEPVVSPEASPTGKISQ